MTYDEDWTVGFVLGGPMDVFDGCFAAIEEAIILCGRQCWQGNCQIGNNWKISSKHFRSQSNSLTHFLVILTDFMVSEHDSANLHFESTATLTHWTPVSTVYICFFFLFIRFPLFPSACFRACLYNLRGGLSLAYCLYMFVLHAHGRWKKKCLRVKMKTKPAYGVMCLGDVVSDNSKFPWYNVRVYLSLSLFMP